MEVKIKRHNTKRFVFLDAVRRAGFDMSYSKDIDSINIACSQCQALVINGLATHEHGCPNARAAKLREQEE